MSEFETIGKEYDAVLLGTSLEMSILAAALSRIGKRVLHLDSNDFYGGPHSTFSLEDTRRFSKIFGPTPYPEVANTESTATSSYATAHDKVLKAQQSQSLRVVDVEEQICVPLLKVKITAEQVVTEPKNPLVAPIDGDNHENNTNGRSQEPLVEKEIQDADGENEAVSSGIDSGVGVSTVSTRQEVAAESKSMPLTSPTTSTAATGNQTVPDVPPESVTPTSDTVETKLEENSTSKISVSWEEVLKQSRRYCIDVVPKVCLSRGSLVQLLISSNIGRYVEFKAVEETQILMSDGVREVPCSKQTLLLNRHIKLGEKRKLMKFLQFCSTIANGSAEDAGDAANTDRAMDIGSDSTDNLAAATTPVAATSDQLGRNNGTEQFSEYLTREWKFSADIAGYVMYAIANVPATCETRVALDAVRLYFSSLGQYGKTPFINPMYGSAEIPQAFCRLCAVFGGVYMLRQQVESFIVADSHGADAGNGGIASGTQDGVPGRTSVLQGVVLAGTRDVIKTPLVVSTVQYLPEIEGTGSESATSCCERVARAVVIVDGQLSPGIGNVQEGVSGLSVPPNTCGNPHTVQVLLLAESSAACPRGKRVIHLTAPATLETARHDLKGVVAHITGQSGMGDTPPACVVWQGYFTCESYGMAASYPREKIPDGLLVAVPTPLQSMHFEACVVEAKRLYDIICTAEEESTTAETLTALEQMVQALDSELNNDIPGRIARVVERTDALAATYGVTHLQHGSHHGTRSGVMARLGKLESASKMHTAALDNLRARMARMHRRIDDCSSSMGSESTA